MIGRRGVLWGAGVVAACLALARRSVARADAVRPALLTDPFLQLPTADGVHVVWFTEFAGRDHHVRLGGTAPRRIPAASRRMSRLAEDAGSHVGAQAGDGSLFPRWTPRPVWRHEAYVEALHPGTRTPYGVSSTTDQGVRIDSGTFTLAPLPMAGQALRLLLTSDHQVMPMTPANLQKVVETVGRVDAVLMAGDLQNVPDRASEWFDDRRGRAFFPALQGRAARAVGPAGSPVYRGGEIIQHAPLFPVIGNHEVMGRFDPSLGLNGMFNDPRPRAKAEAAHDADPDLVARHDTTARAAWVRDRSFNTVTYDEMFTLPADGPAGSRHYALRFGDVFLIGLFGARIWRTPRPDPDRAGKYHEPVARPDLWGGGEFIFEDMAQGSAQYDWLEAVLASDDCRTARWRIAMMHNPAHGLGDNSMPVFAHPARSEQRDADGRLTGVRYDYPRGDDIFVRDVEPLLAAGGVHLLHNGHSHLWARFRNAAGMHLLETSNVGNTYGCYVEGMPPRSNVPQGPGFDPADYPPHGDPHGLVPVAPSVFAPMTMADGRPLPAVASNSLTVFTILETETGRVTSHVFDTALPDGPVRVFDSFRLGGPGDPLR